MDLSRENKNVKICFNHTQYTEHFIHSLNHVYHITWQMYFTMFMVAKKAVTL